MKRDGFSLVELAIVLTIMGVVVGGSFSAVKSARNRSYIAESKENVKSAKDAVIGFSMDYVDLPTEDEFSQELSPIKGKKIDQDKVFFYFVAPELANDEDICTFDTTSLQVDVYDGATLDHTISDIAFVVAAQGINRNIQTGVNSSAPYIVKVYQAGDTADDNSNDFTRDSDDADDIVSYVTLAELQKSVDCSANKLKIINDHALPRDLSTSTDYVGTSSVNVYAAGGYPLSDGGDGDSEDDFEWCLENAPAWLNNNDCNGNLVSQSDCLSASATYNQCTSPTLDGNPSLRGSAGTDMFRIYVKDKTKVVNKTFTITLDTDTSSGTGSGIPGGSGGSGTGSGTPGRGSN
jgi:prepilin-type N-terminal cleavage/methylation domain-containing protein